MPARLRLSLPSVTAIPSHLFAPDFLTVPETCQPLELSGGEVSSGHGISK